MKARKMKDVLLVMSTALSTLFLNGCLKEEGEAPQVADPKAGLLQAMDGHAVTLVKSINQVLIEGAFVKEWADQNPPEPIPMKTDEDVRKGLDYLLGSPVTGQNGEITYTPDPRFCTEVAAQNDPGTCVDVIARARFIQIASAETEGTLQMTYDGTIMPMYLEYSEASLQITVDLNETRTMLAQVHTIMQAHGEQGMTGLPSAATGNVSAKIESGLFGSTITVSIDQAISVTAEDEGNPIQLDVSAATAAIAFSLNPVAGTGSLAFNLPSVHASFSVKDDQQAYHTAVLDFPGATGSFSLDNAAKTLTASALDLLQNQAELQIDGQSAVLLSVPNVMNGKITVAAGEPTFEITDAFSADATLNGTPGIVDGNGTLSLSIEAGTQLLSIQDGEQLKVLQGRVQLNGTGDFNGSMDAQAPSCFQGDENAPVFLTVATCQ